MPIYILFGKYTQDSLKDVSAQRTKKAVKIIEKNGGKVISMYAVMGEHDLVFTLDFPDAEKALSASMALNMLTGISFSTSPVVDVEKFDHLMSKIENL
jgi:uncharacterized protein with GYD domain